MTYKTNNPIRPGILEIYCGPMKSGKTRELINRVDKLNYMTKKDFIFFKPSLDTREKKIKSRFFEEFTYQCKFVSEIEPQEILGIIKEEHHLIMIDEAQFFNQNITQVVKELLLKGKNVVVSGLELDFRGEPFGQMPTLLAMADEVTKLTAVCDYENCNKLATRTQRTINGKPAPYNSPLIMIGDAEEGYQARCLKHHIVPGRPEESLGNFIPAPTFN